MHMAQMAQWNWAGIGLVLGMGAMVALSGLATERLRRWAEKDEDVRRKRPVRSVRRLAGLPEMDRGLRAQLLDAKPLYRERVEPVVRGVVVEGELASIEATAGGAGAMPPDAHKV